MAKGRSLDDAKKVTKKSVAEALGGLPKNKLHCSNLGADALQMAIKDYEDRKAGKPRKKEESEEIHCHTEEEGHKCPYCDSELVKGAGTCNLCGREIGRSLTD